jgi:hypothetical protein
VLSLVESRVKSKVTFELMKLSAVEPSAIEWQLVTLFRRRVVGTPDRIVVLIVDVVDVVKV